MMYLSRRVDFSASHYYRVPSWTDAANQETFGRCSNPSGHGHDYKLEIVVRGMLNDRSGIVMNTTELKRIVERLVEREFDGKLLNLEHPYFLRAMPTTEGMANYLWHRLRGEFGNCELYRVRLRENHYLWAEKEAGSMLKLTRRYHFCAAHRLHSDRLSEEENRELFGKCNNPNGHGHNYYLEVTVEGEPDPVTGMIMNLAELDRIVEREVLDKFDHKHLNLDTEEFRSLNPTSEVVAMVIHRLLRPKLPGLRKIGLWETEKNYFEYDGLQPSC